MENIFDILTEDEISDIINRPSNGKLLYNNSLQLLCSKQQQLTMLKISNWLRGNACLFDDNDNIEALTVLKLADELAELAVIKGD